MIKIEGAWTALVTPFREDGQVDWPGYRRNLAFQIANGITGLLPAGTTGESPTLDWAEHNDVIDRAIEAARGRCRAIAGTGSNSTSEAISGTAHAANSGADAVLLVDCYYNGPSSLELRREYHGAIAQRFPSLTVVPYVIPGRTGCALSPEDLAILAASYPNVSAVKEATGDLERMARTRELTGDKFDIMSGDDDLTLRMMTDPAIRAGGVISVVSNVAPKAVEQLARLVLAGETQKAQQLNAALAPLFGLVTVSVVNQRQLGGRTLTVKDKFRNPLPIKTLMAGLGMPAGPTRPPLGKMTAAGVAVVRNTARKVWESNPEILAPVAAHYEVDIAARLADDAEWESLAYRD
jgi:4-hydroxy-tetrahydrodipicolinate synthase